jgi:lipoprotein-anchoring transpeptidase ErfK/SrfK
MPQWTVAAVRLMLLLGLSALIGQAIQLQASQSNSPPPPAAMDIAVPSPLEVPREAPAAASAAAPASAPFAVDHRLTPDRPLQHGDYVWDEAGAPPGRIRILIDLSAQTLSVFRGGREIGRAVILYGTEEQPTPTGAFTITEKDIDHVSNLYEADMPYMLRLTDDGIAIHGSNVRYGWASRGCVGVPDEFAALLFEQARIGDRVTIVAGTPARTVPEA